MAVWLDSLAVVNDEVVGEASELAEALAPYAARPTQDGPGCQTEWQVYPHENGYLLVLELAWEGAPPFYLAFRPEHYGALATLHRTGTLALRVGPSQAPLWLRIGGLAPGLERIARQLHRLPWRFMSELDALRAALPTPPPAPRRRRRPPTAPSAS